MTKALLCRVVYGAAFCALLPVLLVAWAQRLEQLLPLPTLAPLPWMLFVAGAGIALMAWSMAMLWKFGGGLPMNAFPPPRFTLRGPYALLGHPIYVGFVLVTIGVAAAFGSAAGLLIVAPAVMLGCAALVLGFEARDLDLRFGASRPRAWLRLPPSLPNRAATWSDRARVLLLVLGTWLLVYEAVGHIPVPDAVELMRGAEASWPVHMWWTVIYSLDYLLPVLAVCAAVSGRALSGWSRDALFGMAVGFLIMVSTPYIATPRSFDSASPWAWLMELSRADGVGGRAAFPSFHAYWGFMAAALLWHRGRTIGLVSSVLAVLIAVSCITTGMHATADVIAGTLLTGLALSRERLWHRACSIAERIANAWWELNLGPARLLVHGVYAAIASGAGVLLIAIFAPDVPPWAIAAMALASLLGAAVVGQLLVGSARLQRPFAYFGSVAGVLLGGVALAFGGVSVWPLLAATAAAAPWIQSLGRLRCLVQGCCHGAPMEHGHGITHHRPQSRVAAISGLRGVAIHPTPLYSMLCNVVIGLLVARLCVLGAPASLTVGAYLFMQGAARFVEESYRGEAQTQRLAGLRIYQWFAVMLALLGMALTCVASPATSAPAWPEGAVFTTAALVAAIYALIMGVEFPRSRWPLSRLTPVT
jgi:protein-S-isoprenylcysteine O-methyltransferase Ste14